MGDDAIYDLLNRAYELEDADEVLELVERALALAPDNPEALLLKADLTEEDEDRLPLLERALESTRRYIQDEDVADENLLEDETGLTHLALLQRAAYTLFSLEDDDRSLELVEELLRYDHEDLAMAKPLYYRILLERKEWARTLEETMRESVRGLGWAYARIAATFMLAGGRRKVEKNGKNLNKMLWDAVRMAPNVPFYMLGYMPEPLNDSEDEDFHFAILFEDVWTTSRELLNWFSKGTILFGLLTGRFGDESDDMREILATLGGAADYKELTSHLENASDTAALDTLTAGNYPK
ncbi:MAG: hypothetical protein LBD04_02630 [Synergistaceae bacterium]|jgi:tetratricopeptide (TPR) repeat protein|nr:hypothetical protein [Synergistaceae bacterium]